MAETPPRFFKVILPSTIEDKKLMIPKKFVRKYRDKLPSVCTLTMPNGCDWQVGLTKDEGKIWFHDGWHDFVEYHSICFGHFLVFEFVKNSNFHVHIFDTTACEIQYPSRKMHTSSMQNQAKSSPASARSNTISKCSSTLDSSKFRKMKAKKQKMEEVEVKNEPIDVIEPMQGKWNMNEINNSEGTLRNKRDLSKHAENFCPAGTLVQDLDIEIDTTKFKVTTRNGKDKHRAEVLGNQNELNKAAFEPGQEKRNVNEMYNSQGTLRCKRYLSEHAENFCPAGTSLQDLDIEIDTTKFEATTQNGKDKHQAEVIDNQSKLKKAAYEPRQGKWNVNEMYNSQGTLQRKRDLSEHAENFFPAGMPFQDLDIEIDKTKFKTTTQNGKHKHRAKVKDNQSDAHEIDYQCNDEGSNKDKQNSKFQDEMDSDECFEISEEFFKVNSSPTWQNRAMSTFSSTGGIKRNLQSTISVEKSKEQQSKKNTIEESVEITESNDRNEYDFWNSLQEMGIYITEKHKLLSAEKRVRIIDIARSLKLKNLSFMVILAPHSKRCRQLYVPSKFARKVINKDAKSIKVQVSNGTECSVKICWRCHGGCFLSKGWTKISKYYNWKVGDICIFETVRTKDVLLKLTVYPLV